MFELGGAFGLRIRRRTITYDNIARKNKTAKLKSAKWNWRPIHQIKFPPDFPAIRYVARIYPLGQWNSDQDLKRMEITISCHGQS